MNTILRTVFQMGLAAVSCLACPWPAIVTGDAQLARVFQDHMVLQQAMPIPVWGKADPGEQVRVEFGAGAATATANARGEWRTDLPACEASDEPRTLVVTASKDIVKLRDVLVGEVWLCCGQSNMEWPLSKSTEAVTAIAEARDPALRLLYLRGAARGGAARYTAEQLAGLNPRDYCRGVWQPCTPDAARDFSAVAYYFGQALRNRLGVPVGLICPAIGGTPIESWISREALASTPVTAGLASGNWLENDQLSAWCRERAAANLARAAADGMAIPGDDLGPNHSFKPGFMWEAGVRPLVPFGLRGVIWYQGESNAENRARVEQHAVLFPLMVRSWRAHWRREFPLLYVQLPAMGREFWPAFRDQQRRFLTRLPGLGMAVTIDLGHPTDVHPRRKRPVGERLARWALLSVYEQSLGGPGGHLPAGPLVQSAVPEGHAIRLLFRYAEELRSGDGNGEDLEGFEVAGSDGEFRRTSARIESASVVVKAESRDVLVRYGWSAFPDPPLQLTNATGIPASPFVIELIHPR